MNPYNLYNFDKKSYEVGLLMQYNRQVKVGLKQSNTQLRAN